MQAVSISFFRFAGVSRQSWAFSQMGFARRALRAIPDIGFVKQFGTGGKESFRPYPNPSVYAILAVWPDLETAVERIQTEPVFQRYRAQASETYNVYLNAASARGRWDQQAPFAIESQLDAQAPIAVLTRATVRARHLVRFWRRAPDISAMTTGQQGLNFKMGMGEIPWLHQVTFSIWTNTKAMTDFAYQSGYHSAAVAAKRQEDWFKEELFVRFQLLGHDGVWEGHDPLAQAFKKQTQPDPAAIEWAPEREISQAS